MNDIVLWARSRRCGLGRQEASLRATAEGGWRFTSRRSDVLGGALLDVACGPGGYRWLSVSIGPFGPADTTLSHGRSLPASVRAMIPAAARAVMVTLPI